MSGVLYSALFFVIALGVLITVHEFGHYWVARKAGVKVLRFSIGFGKPLWRKVAGADQTEYVIAAIPLGGYVKMLDEREESVPADQVHRAFNRKSLGARTAVVAAGPLFNFVFAVAAYYLIFIIGVPGFKPIIESVKPDSIAALGGLNSNDEIIAVAGDETPTLEAVRLALVENLLVGGSVELSVRDETGGTSNVHLDISSIGVDRLQDDIFELLGMNPLRPKLPPVVGELQPDGAAAAAGLQRGDHILRVDGAAIDDWIQWANYVRERPEKLIKVSIDRSGQKLEFNVTPARIEEKENVFGRVGASPLIPDDFFDKYSATQTYGPLESIGEAMRKTWDMSILTLRMLWKIVVGEASLENLSGPISIAQYAGQSAQIGLVPFLSFLAIVSVSLAVLNLLPVPVLDGGHLLYYAIEFLKGSPVSEQMQVFGQKLGIVLLGGMMILAIYNDINRIIIQ